jgi:L-alanine-DL-glutamate epimerase-like enolase superfamily enzyme
MTLPPAVPALPIAAIDLWAVRLPLHEPFVIAYGTQYDIPTVIVRIATADGHVGWGEGTPDQIVTGETWGGTVETLRRDLLPYVIGRDARDRAGVMHAMEALVGHAPTAKAAIDIALHDLVARAAGLPVWALLGGQARPHLEISRVVSIKTPEAMAADAVRHVENGFTTVKLKVGDATNPRRDVARIAAVREAIGWEIGLKVDVNQGWKTPGVAIQAIRGALAHGPDYIEQPVLQWDIDGLAEVRRQTGAIIMADEACHGPREMLRIVQQRAADLVNIKLMKTGGLLGALAVNTIAETAGIRAQVGTMVESSIASAAGLHLAMALENVKTVEMGGPLMIAEEVGDLRACYDRNRITLRDAPGLGVTIDPARVQRFSEGHWQFA